MVHHFLRAQGLLEMQSCNLTPMDLGPVGFRIGFADLASLVLILNCLITTVANVL